MSYKLLILSNIKYSLMLKYLSVIILAFSFIACQGDSEESAEGMDQQQPQQDQQQSPDAQGGQQGQQGEMEQGSAPDIDVSDDELDTFTDAIAEAQEVQMAFQQEMVEMMEDEGMDIETFNQIAQSEQTGQSTDDLDVSDEEMENFEAISAKIEEEQAGVEEEIEEAVESAGMEMDRFEEINQAIQQDPELQQRIQERMQDMEPQEGQQQPQQQQQPPQGQQQQ